MDPGWTQGGPSRWGDPAPGSRLAALRGDAKKGRIAVSCDGLGWVGVAAGCALRFDGAVVPAVPVPGPRGGFSGGKGCPHTTHTQRGTSDCAN